MCPGGLAHGAACQEVSYSGITHITVLGLPQRPEADVAVTTHEKVYHISDDQVLPWILSSVSSLSPTTMMCSLLLTVFVDH